MDGRVVLVPFVLPGERVEATLGKGTNSQLGRVVEPSPLRVAPPCPLFEECGGCHYQHAPYEFQAQQKIEILREQLRRVGKLEYAGEIGLITGQPLGYRNRVQLHIDGDQLGYLAPQSHRLAPLKQECSIASPRLNELISVLRERLPDPRFPKFVHSIELFTNETDVQVNVLESDRPVAHWFYESFGSVVALDYPTSAGLFRVSPRSFFQVNRFLMDQLVQAALPQEGGATALDLYAGVGLFALSLAGKFKSVTAVESGLTSVRDLQFNSSRAGVRVRTENARVEDYLARMTDTPDFVLADPPRAGLGSQTVEHLNRLRPNRITIVACDPATLARDLAALKGYRVNRITVVDLFPQTYHLESVVELERS